MSNQIRLTDHFDYLQRVGFNPATLAANLPATSAPDIQSRRVVRVDGVGRLEKPAPGMVKLGNNQPMRMPSEDALIGLYGAQVPLAFIVSAGSRGVAIQFGVWSPSDSKATPEQLNSQQAVLTSVLNGIFPALKAKEINPAELQLPRLPLSGIALGIPSGKPPDPLDNSLQLDRLIRALSGTQWAFVVLAKPLDEIDSIAVRSTIVAEMHLAETAKEQGQPVALADAYTEMLKIALKSLTHAEAVGAWRTAVYLLGDVTSYARLASVWRSVFSGDESLPEPVRVWTSSVAIDLALKWAMPNVEGTPGQGPYRQPFQFQTLLTSSQLAAYIHLPQLETLGFGVSVIPNFDVMRQASQDESQIQLGEILRLGNPTQSVYEVGLKSLTRHAFVAGVTGAGKTNTIFHILKEARKAKIPFAVIEPAKKEYRALIKDPSIGELQVFTLGDELHSPFRLNPFEVVSWPTIAVGVHVDLLRSVFTASFGMWTPLPQILEQCLHEVYKDRGWDTTSNTNYRLDATSDVADAFPTLSELAAKVDEVIQKLGYEQKISDDMRAALHTRINSLRAGAKGRMLDVQRSLPMDGLLNTSTVFELQEMGDDDDKAFMMGLLLIRLYEYRRASEESKDLHHLLVIEEAHRLLTNVGARRSQEEADPRGKAVETFANLLSEIRAYGQGVTVADQIPVKLAPEIIKNTNLKIVHRVVAADDRAVLAGAMAMDERQALALATFKLGQAAVFSEEDDAPVLVQVQREKGEDTVDDETVKQYMANSNIVTSNKMVFRAILPDIEITKPEIYTALESARAISDDPSFRRDFVRLVISITEDESALDDLLGELEVRAQGFRQRDMDKNVMLRAMIIFASKWFAQRRGTQNGWTYAETAELENGLRQVLLMNLGMKGRRLKVKEFQALMYRLHARPFEPFPGCNVICDQAENVCLYRRAVYDFIAASKEKYVADFEDAKNADEAEGAKDADEAEDAGLPRTWEQCKAVARELSAFDEDSDAFTRIGLCYAQHMLADRVRPIHDIYVQALRIEAQKQPTEVKND